MKAADRKKTEPELNNNAPPGQSRVAGRLEARRTEKAVSRSKLATKGLLITAAAIILLMGIIFAASALVNSDGAFTITATKSSLEKRAISLSETEGFSNPTVKLDAQAIQDMDNITYDWLPMDELDTKAGSYNGENYIAYTFYLKNSGMESLNYAATLQISKVSRHVDDAVRIMAYRNGEPTIYAAPAENGKAESFPENVVSFESTSTVFQEIREGLQVDEIDRWTFVVWLEGEDPECINDVMGGNMKLDLDLQIVDENGEAEEEESAKSVSAEESALPEDAAAEEEKTKTTVTVSGD